MADTSKGLGVDEDHRISRSPLTKLRIALMRPVFRLSRGMTLGSRTAVIDAEGRFLLVKQTYTPGWIFPGGGVERGEACETAALRELEEEAGILVKEPPSLIGIFNNNHGMKGDHLAFFVVRAFKQKPFSPNLEIADAKFFHVKDLPERVEGGSRRRIDEIVSGRKPSLEW
jgi:8-oxo-dGTP pyrophosphatase MutT (NUDIX family)